MKKILFALLFCITLLPCTNSYAQSVFLTNLCQRWQLEVIEIKDSGKKYPPDEKMKDNYLIIKADGSFLSHENGTITNGKWKADELKMELITSDFDNQNLTSPVIFTIAAISKYKLALTPAPTEGLKVVMHYYSKKAKEKKKRK